MFPVHEWIEQKLPKYPNVASLLSCIVLTFIIVVPLLFVFAAIVQQGSAFSQNVYQCHPTNFKCTVVVAEPPNPGPLDMAAEGALG